MVVERCRVALANLIDSQNTRLAKLPRARKDRAPFRKRRYAGWILTGPDVKTKVFIRQYLNGEVR